MTIQIGERYGHLTVLERNFNEDGWYWICRCDCGKTVVKPKESFRCIRPNTSCGCMRYKNLKNSHGYSKTHEFNGESHTIVEWAEILGCSEDTVRTHYKQYIHGKKPREYVFDPSHYRRCAPKYAKYEYGGESHTLSEWTRILGCDRAVLNKHMAVYRKGQRDLDYVFDPSSYRKINLQYEYHGESHTIVEWAKILGRSDSTVRAHLERYENGSKPLEYVFESSSYQDYICVRRAKA